MYTHWATFGELLKNPFAEMVTAIKVTRLHNPYLCCVLVMQFLTSLNIMDYSLLVGIHDADLAEAGNDFDDVLGGIDSNEDSEPESPREADSPQESDSPGEAEMALSDTPPTTPPANFNGARERNISFGSNELDEREDDDDTEGFQSVDGRFLLVNNSALLNFANFCSSIPPQPPSFRSRIIFLKPCF